VSEPRPRGAETEFPHALRHIQCSAIMADIMLLAGCLR
jgi:hypothetical protein